MQRRYIVIGLAVVAFLAFAGAIIWGGNGWDHTSVTRVVPGQNGETLVITDDRSPGFVPFAFFVPFVWLLLAGGLLALAARRRWGGGPLFGPGHQQREAWLNDWHRHQHDNAGAPTSVQAHDADQPDSTE